MPFISHTAHCVQEQAAGLHDPDSDGLLMWKQNINNVLGHIVLNALLPSPSRSPSHDVEMQHSVLNCFPFLALWLGEKKKKSQNKENNFVDSSHFQNHEVCYALFCLCSALDTNCGANQGLALILRSVPGWNVNNLFLCEDILVLFLSPCALTAPTVLFRL